MLALVLSLAQTQAPIAPAAQRQVEDARARAAFATLESPARREFQEYLELELQQAQLFGNQLVRFVLRTDGRKPADFAEAHALEFFDPATHAPAQPIARHALAEGDAELVEARRTFRPAEAARALQSAWSYDYGRRAVVRQSGWDDPARVVANALAGFAPGHDLALALVEQVLDDGAQQKVLAAFDHMYTDRAGKAFPGITLFDAWSSGAEIEMPDVDTLGLYHTLTDDWTSYRAPIPGNRQEPLYKKLGEPFREASRHRGLRHALALTFLEGRPELGLYEGLRDNLHLVWEEVHSTPSELAPTLPKVAAREAWIEARIADGREHPEAWKAAELRRDTLARGADAVRAITLAGLHEFGAYKKLDAQPEKDH